MLCARFIRTVTPYGEDPTPTDYTLPRLVHQIDASDAWPRHLLETLAVARTSDALGRRADHIVGQTLWALSATQNATHGRVCAARTQGQVWVHLERTNTATQVRTDSEEGSPAMAVTDSALYFLHVNGTLDIYSLDSLAEPPVRLRAHAEGHVDLAVTLRALPGGCRCFH